MTPGSRDNWILCEVVGAEKPRIRLVVFRSRFDNVGTQLVLYSKFSTQAGRDWEEVNPTFIGLIDFIY